MQHGRGTVQHIGRGSYRKWDASSDRSAVLGKCCGSEEKLYSINTPLTTSKFKIRASPAFQKTPINTVDVYVLFFNLRSISQGGRRGFDPRLPGLRNQQAL
jgi:hypothetical protein